MSALQKFLEADSADTGDLNIGGAFYNSNAFYNMSLQFGADVVNDYYIGPNQSSEDYGFYCRNFDGNISYLNVSCLTNLKFSLPLYG